MFLLLHSLRFKLLRQPCVAPTIAVLVRLLVQGARALLVTLPISAQGSVLAGQCVALQLIKASTSGHLASVQPSEEEMLLGVVTILPIPSMEEPSSLLTAIPPVDAVSLAEYSMRVILSQNHKLV